jgi:hypothetical protein
MEETIAARAGFVKEAGKLPAARGKASGTVY